MTVSYTPTEYDEADYPAIVRISKAVRPDDFVSVEDLGDWDTNQRRAGRRVLRWQAVVDGEVVGFGSVSQSPWLVPAMPFANVMVHPEHQHRGIGRSVLGRVETTARDLSAHTLLAYTQEDRPRAMRFLEAAGYEEYDREWRSTLNLTTFDPIQWDEAVNRVQSSEIRIASVADLRQTIPDWAERLHDLYTSVEQDVPTPLPVQHLPQEDFDTLVLGRKMIDDGFFVAIDGDEFVGLTERNASTARTTSSPRS